MSGAATVRAASQRAQAAVAALLEAWREADGDGRGVAGVAVASVLVDAGLRRAEAELLVERLSEVAARGALPAAVGGAHGGEPAAAVPA